eukprot:CAMPEP_0115886162 /NCGR_PEP_ID=MMETSP0287-20121206/31061_1 /TAXON_ID=412157 /ORGANISM="Chrysochromulina rotalis, Strain UIO044" /LENGTH=30 /DNA_ID= /DNA_START= /DNA_END= /DNA_ORIENTATION=
MLIARGKVDVLAEKAARRLEGRYHHTVALG